MLRFHWSGQLGLRFHWSGLIMLRFSLVRSIDASLLTVESVRLAWIHVQVCAGLGGYDQVQQLLHTVVQQQQQHISVL